MTTISHPPSLDESFARLLDREDPLASFRSEFHLAQAPDGQPWTYLLGNSLGLMPKAARPAVEEELTTWEELAVEGHFRAERPWATWADSLRDSMARVVGAMPDEVVVMNTLTVNLHLMLASFYRPRGARRKVLMEARAFPSDQYAVATHLALRGGDPTRDVVVARPREGEDSLRTEDLLALIEQQGSEIALVLLGGVNYYTGQLFDLGGIAEVARRQGCVVGYDLAHAAGNVPLALHDWKVDFAVWCTYKYLNGGPGSIAAAFVHERHGTDPSIPRLAGWYGNDPEVRFEMRPDFEANTGASGWQLSNPPILSMAPLRVALEQFDRAGMDALRRKSESLTGYLEALLLAIPGAPVRILTPANPAERGCQLSLHLPGRGRWLFDALRNQGILGDYREPDVVRLAPAPLYNSFHEAWRVAGAIRSLLAGEGA